MRTLLLAGLVGCASTDRSEDAHPSQPMPVAPVVIVPAAPPVPAKPAPPPSCIDDGKPFDQVVLRERVTTLASKELDGRVPGTDGDRATRKLIVDRFRCLGLLGPDGAESGEHLRRPNRTDVEGAELGKDIALES